MQFKAAAILFAILYAAAPASAQNPKLEVGNCGNQPVAYWLRAENAPPERPWTWFLINPGQRPSVFRLVSDDPFMFCVRYYDKTGFSDYGIKGLNLKAMLKAGGNTTIRLDCWGRYDKQGRRIGDKCKEAFVEGIIQSAGDTATICQTSKGVGSIDPDEPFEN